MKLRALKGIGRGSLCSIILYCLLVFILSIIMMSLNVDEKYYKFLYSFISLLALAAGSVFSAKYNGKRGFLMGFAVSIIFSFFLASITFLSTGKIEINGELLKRILIDGILGIFCGSLGVNLWHKLCKYIH